MRDFTSRSVETELMDTEAADLDEIRPCLRDLAVVNTLTAARRPTLAWIKKATRGFAPGERVSLLDVGFGHGDMLRKIHDWCTAQGFRPDLTGVDLNPWSASVAQAATPRGMGLTYVTGDVFAFQPARPVDFIVSSQFTHHLTDGEAAAFIAWMEQRAVRGWFINDLHRHALPFYAFRAAAKLAGFHRFVQHDGPISIARGFRRDDWNGMVRAAGLEPSAVEVRWWMPFRLCVGRIR